MIIIVVVVVIIIIIIILLLLYLTLNPFVHTDATSSTMFLDHERKPTHTEHHPLVSIGQD